MASAITLKGINRAVSQLGYTNENTLKYRFIQYIRNYYVDDHSLASLKKIDHTSMIKLLWDTHDDPEIIKNRRKNLNSLRSSVNADLKKLYKKGLNPEGIKIGSDNIFVMSEDAKDSILDSHRFDLKPDGTLKIDQIMDILKLASQTVSSALGVEDTTTEDGLRKKDQLKDLIKGLSEKLGLGDPEYPKAGAGSGSQQYESQVSSDDIGKEGNIEAADDDKIISEIADIEDEEVLEAVVDFKEDEILDVIEDTDEEDFLEDADEDILDDVEDIVTDVIEDSDPETDVREEVLDENVEDAAEEDTELEYVDAKENGLSGGDVAGKPGDESGTGIEGISEGLSRDQGLGQGKGGKGTDEPGSMTGNLNEGHDGAAPDAVDEIMELDDLDDVESIDEENILDDDDIDTLDDVEDIVTDVIEDSDPETDVEEEALDENVEEAPDEDTGLGYVDVEEDEHIGEDKAGKSGDESGTGVEGISEGLSRDQGLGQGKGGKGTDEPGSMTGNLNEGHDGAAPDAVDEIMELDDLDDVESIDEEDILEDADEDTLDDVEDIVTDVIEDSDPETDVEEEALDEDIEDAAEEDTGLEYVDAKESGLSGGDIAGKSGDESGTGVEGISEGLSRDQGLGQGKGGKGTDEPGSMTGNLNEGHDGAAPDAVDEIMELDDLDDVESIDEEDFLEDADEDILDDVEDIVTDVIEDSDSKADVEEEALDENVEEAAEKDAELGYVDAKESGLSGGDIAGKSGDESRTGGHEKEIEQLGLPVDSFGEDYGTKKGTKLKKERLLAEAFDGYLGSMDRYYNHYILISDGEYLIGSRNPKKDEKPEQIVHLNSFYFGRFPVTNGLFEIFVEKTGYITTAEKVGYGTVYYGRFEKKTDDRTGLITSKWNSSLYCKMVKGACWYRPAGPESTLHNKRNHPVVQVSMEDAAAFAAWTGKRLPTENEWEAASRTENGLIFPWGHEWKNNACNIEESGFADTSPVDKYAEFENDFGIVDVLGNVLEWTSDGFKLTSQGNFETTFQVAKGGSWVSGNDIQLYCRFKLEPDTHSNILGFRCVAH